MRRRRFDQRLRYTSALSVGLAAIICAGASAAPNGLAADTVEGPSGLPVPTIFVSPNGSDGGTCSKPTPCRTWNRAYQVAKPGNVVEIAGGEYEPQDIAPRGNTRNLSPGCSPATTDKCIVFQPAEGQQVVVRGGITVRGSSIWIRGKATPGAGIPRRSTAYNIKVLGFIDTEAASEALHPDHVIVEGVDAVSFGIFSSRAVTFRNMDIGPATVGARCRIAEGPGFENKIGFGGGIPVVPTDVTLDRMLIHNQNRDADGQASDCHFGGLFIVTVDGLTIKNSVFSQNAVYNIQIQNFSGPPPQNVRIENNLFGCPVEWLYDTARGGENACNGQVDIQFNAASLFRNWLIRYNSLAAGIGQYVPGASYENVRIVGNVTGGLSGCYAGMTFGYNASGGRTCDATDRRLGGTPFVSSTPGQEDFALRRGTGATAFVPPASPDLRIRLDMEGRIRPLKFPKDAGALQRDTALIVPGRTIGSAAIGMKRAAILTLYDKPRRSTRAKIGPMKTLATIDRFAVPGGTLHVTSVEDRVVGLETTSRYYTLPNGLGPGSPRGDADRLRGFVWTSCEHAFRRTGRVVVSFVARGATVTSVRMIRRAHAGDCTAGKG